MKETNNRTNRVIKRYVPFTAVLFSKLTFTQQANIPFLIIRHRYVYIELYFTFYVFVDEIR